MCQTLIQFSLVITFFFLNHRLSTQDHLKLYWTGACLVIKKEKNCWVPGGENGKLKKYGWFSWCHFSLVQWFYAANCLLLSWHVLFSHTAHLTTAICCSCFTGGVKWVCAREWHPLRVRLAFHLRSWRLFGPECLWLIIGGARHSEEQRGIGDGGLCTRQPWTWSKDNTWERVARVVLCFSPLPYFPNGFEVVRGGNDDITVVPLSRGWPCARHRE